VTELAKCWGCHKPVRFVPTEKGNLMPLDPDPADHSLGTARLGNASLAIRDGRVHVLRPDEPWDGDLYVAHFATCPEARRSNRRILRKAVDAALARVKEGLDEER
jgi:hypothetical protein